MTTSYLSRLVPLVIGLGLLAGGLTGCNGGSSAKADVSGTIKLKGQPPKYTGLQVVFTGSDGTQALGPINEDGTYKAEGVPVGEVKVHFIYITPEAVQEGERFKAGGGRLQKPGQAGPAPKISVPKGPAMSPIREDLREALTSKVTCKVEAGKPNTFDYDLP